MQRPPTWSAASSTTKRLPAAASRRPAAMPAAPAPTTTASTQPERGTSGAGAGRGAASAGAAARAAAEEARNDRRLKRLMAYRGVKRCEIYHGTRVTRVENLSYRRHACGMATAMPYSNSAPTWPEPRQGDDDDRRGRQGACSDVLAAIPVGAVEIRRACPCPDRAYRHWPSSIAGVARNRRCELGRDRIRHQRPRAAVDPHLGCF